jgi:hypothetical protein
MKKILLAALGLLLAIILAGMFKFNFLASLDGYDVDGNKIQNKKIEKRVQKDNERSDLKKGEVVETMIVSVPRLIFINDNFQIIFENYRTPKTEGVLGATLRELFGLRGNRGNETG